VNIDLSTGAPPSPERTRQLAETMAEIMRVLNHQTRHPESIGESADVDRVVRELSSVATRLPQLLRQLSAWLEAKQQAGRITAVGGDYAGRPDAAVMAEKVRLDVAGGAALVLAEELDHAAAITCDLAAETGEDGDDE
jgi:hypothetical protein